MIVLVSSGMIALNQGVWLPIVAPMVGAIAQHAQNAVNCAIAMSQKLSMLNHHWHEQGSGTFQMRVGICTGTVVVGSLGSKDR